MGAAILTIAAIWAGLIILFVWATHRLAITAHALAKVIEDAGQDQSQRLETINATITHGEVE